MEKFNIKIESMPKGTLEETHPNINHWNIETLEEARKIIINQRVLLTDTAKWYKIYQNDQLIFDSLLMRS